MHGATIRMIFICLYQNARLLLSVFRWIWMQFWTPPEPFFIPASLIYEMCGLQIFVNIAVCIYGCASQILQFAVCHQNVILCHVMYTFLMIEWHIFTNTCGVFWWLCTQWPFHFELFNVGNFVYWLISKSFFFLPFLVWMSKDYRRNCDTSWTSTSRYSFVRRLSITLWCRVLLE